MILSRTVFKLAAAGLVAAGALTVAASANAGTSWSVGINVPGVVVSEPAPVYYEPAPVYTHPAPTYYQAPRPVYSVPPPVYYDPAARWENVAPSAGKSAVPSVANGAAASGSASSTAATTRIATEAGRLARRAASSVPALQLCAGNGFVSAAGATCRPTSPPTASSAST